MKKTIISAICLALVLPMFNSCKKGENDPMSLKSRKARLTGEWVLAEAEGTVTSGGDFSSWTYNGTTRTELEDSDISTSLYSETIEILKDGTFEGTISESSTYDEFGYTRTYTDNSTITGTWTWLGKDKENEFKNKERFGLSMLTYTSTWTMVTRFDDGSPNDTDSDTDIYTFSGDADVAVFRIDQLKNKEMIIVEEYTVMSGSYLTTYDETSTYEKQ